VFQAEDGIRDFHVTGVQTCALPISAFGLAGIDRITSTGDGDEVAYWNRYVAVTQMGGHGTFVDPRIGVDVTNGNDDLVSAKLPRSEERRVGKEGTSREWAVEHAQHA